MSTVPPDWYPDPSDVGFLRYWNGTDWTTDRKPVLAKDSVDRTQALGQAPKVPLLGARAHAKRQSEELADALSDNQRLRAHLTSTGGLEVAELQRLRDQLAAQITEQQTLLDSLRTQVVNTREDQVLQEIGIYEYRHPLSDAVAYRDALKHLQGEIKYMARRDGGAIEASQTWAVNGSAAEGRRMIREYSMLMLRAYNAEADNLVRGLKPYKLPTSLERLDKIAFTIERLGKTMHLRITPGYHELRRRELQMTADHLELLARQKEHEREQRETLREERRAQEELARERARLEKQEQQCRDKLSALEAAGSASAAGADDLRERLAELERAILALKNREDNIRAGYVYVLSNIGAFGAGVVMIGLTRRVDPADRIRELGNTSVPFKYDRHTMFFSQDAVGIEAELHRRLAHKRINKLNNRREFFKATPAEVRELLQAVTGELVEFDELAEAMEYRQSLAVTRDRDRDRE
ncbi:DUF4041 domain-containing protein [Nocardia sp. bgisy134]|uniref:DUF4041 domain-containing protein n=1 Tax=Nocardia sp. bgisy134 TaxID=3413789 RepID=UPI003D71A09C